ncbi:MAG: dTMP kinase [Candidatus Hodarchaeales archaeon]|jgi:dTMP kinase
MTSLPYGILIAFEGIDGSGKTTQIYKVAEYLRGLSYPVTVTHEPNPNSPFSQLIQQRVKKQRENVTPDQELDWYTEDRRWDLENNILPALARNELVLVDRYYMSSAAYQGALEVFTLNYVLEKNSFAKRPDLWIILDVPVKLGQARLKMRDKHNDDQLEKAEYQKKVLVNYQKLSKMDLGGQVIWIDASIEEAHLTQVIGKTIIDFLKEFVKS